MNAFLKLIITASVFTAGTAFAKLDVNENSCSEYRHDIIVAKDAQMARLKVHQAKVAELQAKAEAETSCKAKYALYTQLWNRVATFSAQSAKVHKQISENYWQMYLDSCHYGDNKYYSYLSSSDAQEYHRQELLAKKELAKISQASQACTN